MAPGVGAYSWPGYPYPLKPDRTVFSRCSVIGLEKLWIHPSIGSTADAADGFLALPQDPRRNIRSSAPRKEALQLPKSICATSSSSLAPCVPWCPISPGRFPGTRGRPPANGQRSPRPACLLQASSQFPNSIEQIVVTINIGIPLSLPLYPLRTLCTIRTPGIPERCRSPQKYNYAPFPHIAHRATLALQTISWRRFS